MSNDAQKHVFALAGVLRRGRDLQRDPAQPKLVRWNANVNFDYAPDWAFRIANGIVGDAWRDRRGREERMPLAVAAIRRAATSEDEREVMLTIMSEAGRQGWAPERVPALVAYVESLETSS